MPRTTYNFVLETRGRDVLDDEVFDALCEAGCDDAGIGRFLGVDHLDFDREARSYCEAVLRAGRLTSAICRDTLIFEI